MNHPPGSNSVLLVVLTVLSLVPGLTQAVERPNIILVMADDQGWGDMAYQGHPQLQTPNFDAMARNGLRFDRFYAAAPVCSPTRGSVMTGRHPNRFGCFSWGHTLRPQEITLAEALQQAGYRTGHFGKWHLGSVRSGSPVHPGASGFDEWVSAPNFFDNDPVLSAEGTAVAKSGESSLVTVEAALQFVRQQVARSHPFLAVVWFGSPHLPHEALPEDRQPYADQPERLQHFYGEITAMDRAFGKLRDELDQLGIRENTLLWYCSDNGALPNVGSSGGRRGHKGDLHEGGLLVPAILEWPLRIPRPRSTSVPCNISDLYPTLLEITGLTPKNQPVLDGISLAPLIEGRMQTRPTPMGFWVYPAPGIRTPSKAWMAELLAAQRVGQEPDDPEKLRLDAGKITTRYPENPLPGHSAWVDQTWKLHRIANRTGREVRFQLYDLAVDPTESNDLAEGEPVRAEQMKQALETWQRSVIRSLNGEDYPEREQVEPRTRSSEANTDEPRDMQSTRAQVEQDRGPGASLQYPGRSLKEAVGDRFKIGVGVSHIVVQHSDDAALILQHFQSLTPENCMKPQGVQPAEGHWNFAAVDRFAAFARSNKLELVGHCLVWAKDDRTDEWMKQENGEPVSRETLLRRIETHIHTVVQRYGDVATAWDVVNEALGDSDAGLLRDSVYSRTAGIDFIVTAFNAARAKAPDALLIYNDYNGHKPGKREKLIELLTQLKQKGAPVDAYGMQGHFELGDNSVPELRETFDALRKLGLKVVVSELDIDVVQRSRWWADGGKHREDLAAYDPYKDGLPNEIEQMQIDQYVELFKLFDDYSDLIERISFWNLHDGQSWLNHFPWRRTNYPLLFDRNRRSKPAFDAVCALLQANRQNARHRSRD